MADITGSITKIRTSDNSEHYINAKYWDGHEWGELASALKYCGITTTKLTDGATTNPVVIGDTNHTATAGCVVFYEDTEGGKSTTKEFVFNGSKWELLGADSTYKVVQSTVSSPNADGSAMAFIDTISQDANGVITVTKKYCKKQYRLEYTATGSLGHLYPCDTNSVLHEYDTSTGKGVFVYDEAPTSIGDAAFLDCTNLTSVTIPNSVTTIGEEAFSDCTSLKSVTIGDSVTVIGEYAFSHCTSLTSVTIPDSVTDIGQYAFDRCTSLTSVTIGNGVTSIGVGVFYECTLPTSITIPDSVTSIGLNAFYNCESLTSITIPDSVTSIGSNAFYNCGGELIINSKIVENNYTSDKYPSLEDYGWLSGAKFTKLTIGDSVTKIGNYTFKGCTSLTSVTIPDSVTSIGEYAFSGCSSLKSVTIGNGVTSTSGNTFYQCTSLKSVTIGNGVTSIGEYEFAGCSSLSSITIPDSVTSIENNAFYRCYSLKNITIPDSVTSIGNETFAGCSMKSITIPDSVTSIGWAAFTGCSELTNITIGRGVTEIGLTVITKCDNLTTVYCKPTTPPSLSDSSLLELGRMIYVPMESVDAYKSAEIWCDYVDNIIGCVFEDENLVSGENIKTINGESILGEGNIELNIELGSKNFPSDDELWYISASNSIQYAYEGAFGDSQVVSHTYENGIGVIKFNKTLTEITMSVFGENERITSLYIPEKVTSIGQNAFGDLILTEVFMGSKIAPELYDANVFGNWDAVVNSLKIWIPVDAYDSYMRNAEWHYYWESFRPYIKGGENLISGKNIATINGAYIIGDLNFNLVSKSDDGYVDESLTPKYTSLSLGSSSKPWSTVYVGNFCGSGEFLVNTNTANWSLGTPTAGNDECNISGERGSMSLKSKDILIKGKNNVTVEGHFYCSDYFEVNTDGICYATAFYETSDENLKDFSDDIVVDFNKLKEIRKSYFTWKDGEQKLHIGTSAQDVQKVYPELVSENSEGNLTVDYAKLSIIALSAIDKLDERLSRIENILNKEE